MVNPTEIYDWHGLLGGMFYDQWKSYAISIAKRLEKSTAYAIHYFALDANKLLVHFSSRES
jgi:hypothetical protein